MRHVRVFIASLKASYIASRCFMCRTEDGGRWIRPCLLHRAEIGRLFAITNTPS